MTPFCKGHGVPLTKDTRIVQPEAQPSLGVNGACGAGAHRIPERGWLEPARLPPATRQTEGNGVKRAHADLLLPAHADIFLVDSPISG